jgi:hypothetical protein
MGIALVRASSRRLEATWEASSGLVAAGPFFFVSAWLLLIFAGVAAADVGIYPFGYVTHVCADLPAGADHDHPLALNLRSRPEAAQPPTH